MKSALPIVCLLGCASSTDPRIDAVEPPVATNLVATDARVTGRDLFGVATADLDHGEATIDRQWRLAIGDLPIAAEWVDAQHLRFVIPAGIAPGSYDIVAESPRGERLVAAGALAITAEPVGLRLSIEDAPGGGGQPITATLGAGEALTAFAVVRDPAGAFVTDIDAAWSVSAPIGALTGATLLATKLGTGRLVATRAAAQLAAESGDIRVVAGAAAALAIEDAPGGAGQPIGNVAGLTTDDPFTAYAIARDAYGNFVEDAVATWSLTGVAGLYAPRASTAAIDFATPGIGVLHATSFATAQTGDLAIAPGRAATLVIAPAGATISADAAPTAFTATGNDADGNPTTNLGALAWSVDAGAIGALSASGLLDPTLAGTGTIRVTSSHGASATTALTIAPGAPAALAIAPPSLAVDADAAPTTFVATATDADGNATDPGALAWSIGSGPITTISAAGVFDPRAAGTGTIAVTSTLGPSATAPVTIAPGRAATLAITPATVDVVQGAPAMQFAVSATDADANPTTNLGTIAWAVASGSVATLAADGTFTPAAPGIGAVRATSSFGATSTSGTVRVRSPAALSATLAVPANTAVGQGFTAQLSVTNTGEAAAVNVTPCALSTSGLGSVSTSAPSPASAPLAPGATTTFAWPVTATAAGSVQLASCATGSDAELGAAIASAAATATTAITVPVILTSTLAVRAWVGLGKSFTVTMQVTNTGSATATVSPSALALGGAGTVSLNGAPAGGVSIASGATTSFVWTYASTALGNVTFAGNATGSDAVTMQPASSPVTSAETDVVEAMLIGGDPFGDGTPYTFAAGYRGHVVLGPNRTGNAAVQLADDLATFEPLTFRFARDVGTGNTPSNPTVPYTSIGYTGCTPSTATCGPDNEDGRGLFTSATFGGNEYLVAGGARSNGDLDYVYMTTDTDAQLDFMFVDFSNYLFANSHALTAVHPLGSRLYFGLRGDGAARPYLVALATTPTAPGDDLSGGAGVDLDAYQFPGWQSASVEGIDALGDLLARLYVAGRAGIMAATVATPRAYGSNASDWASATPSAAAYGAKTSRTSAKLADLEPRDRAFSQLASFGGRLWAGRNTTAGPQLWSCNPALGAVATRCEPGDWSLVAANTTGDTQLTQFNDTALTSITMVVGTATELYVGFDGATGVHVFKTTSTTASTRADFVGQAGCSAAAHPATCAGIGGAGFGTATDQRIFDAKAITVAGVTSVWVTVGDASSASGLVVLP